jgi:ABC-type amino acid transport substrate-binding protein
MARFTCPIRTALLLWILCLIVLAGCTRAPVTPNKPPLRVGINPFYPPIAFKLDRKVRGVEIDLATMLGAKLGRDVQFVELRWQRLIPTLVAGNIDIIMSGMTITQSREFQIDFTAPYLETGQMAALRIKDRKDFPTKESVLKTNANIGVVRGTTGDIFTEQNIPNARVLRLTKVQDAPSEFKRETIDLFIYDAPAILWLVSANEGELTNLSETFTEEHLGWGIRRDNRNFLNQVNDVLQTWKQDGTLDRVLDRWLPTRPREPY